MVRDKPIHWIEFSTTSATYNKNFKEETHSTIKSPQEISGLHQQLIL